MVHGHSRNYTTLTDATERFLSVLATHKYLSLDRPGSLQAVGKWAERAVCSGGSIWVTAPPLDNSAHETLRIQRVDFRDAIVEIFQNGARIFAAGNAAGW